jgi:hypothetical protein
MNYFRCPQCKQSLSEDCFTPSRRKNGDWCKKCKRKHDQLPEAKEKQRLAKKRYYEKNKNKPEYKEKQRLYHKLRHEKNKNNPEYRASRLHSHFKSRYKLTDEQLAALKAVKICQNPGCNNPATCIDHCHASEKVRGRLCNGCNTSLGMLSEDPARITGLVEYLKAQ